MVLDNMVAIRYTTDNKAQEHIHMKNRVDTLEIYTIHPKELVLHPEALATPKMSEDNYNALKDDIELNGQIDPVTTYRGKIVDGRHRWLILQELEIDTIMYTKLPNNITLAEIKQLVQSKELRRHETAAQLAIRAYRLKTAPDSQYKSFAKAAQAVGANPKRIVEIKKIVELYGRPDIVELLFNGEMFNTGSDSVPFWTDSAGTVLRWLEEHGTLVGSGARVAEIKPRKELTEDEQHLVTSYIAALSKESALVLEHIANELYSRVKEN